MKEAFQKRPLPGPAKPSLWAFWRRPSDRTGQDRTGTGRTGQNKAEQLQTLPLALLRNAPSRSRPCHCLLLDSCGFVSLNQKHHEDSQEHGSPLHLARTGSILAFLKRGNQKPSAKSSRKFDYRWSHHVSPKMLVLRAPRHHVVW